MTLIQRFGSTLNLNIHLHILLLDGVYVRAAVGEGQAASLFDGENCHLLPRRGHVRLNKTNAVQLQQRRSYAFNEGRDIRDFLIGGVRRQIQMQSPAAALVNFQRHTFHGLYPSVAHPGAQAA